MPAKRRRSFGLVNATFFSLAPAADRRRFALLVFCNARQYSIVKDHDCLSNQLSQPAQQTADLVGLGGLEPPTSSLSGMRSSHLSYRPKEETGGAGRDRTGDLLNANQALSQLSYSPNFRRFRASGSGSEIKSRPVGCRDRRGQLAAASKRTGISKWRCQDGLTIFAVARIVVWSGTAVSYSAPRTLRASTFRDSTHVLS
jgi:hypothetical protein